MPGFNDGWLGVPSRPGKPRQNGLTHVMDKGLNIRDIEGMFDTAGDFVDIVKLGWGTSYVTNNLEKKIALYRHFDTPGRLRRHAVRGGLRQGQARRVQGVADRAPLRARRDLRRHDRHPARREARADRATSPATSRCSPRSARRTPTSSTRPYQWVEWIKEELEAGSWKVITEAREGGTAGIFRKDGDMRTGLIDEIVHGVPVDDLIFEAPTKSSQAWFVKQFGPNVNLGNIPPDEVIPLETLRLGLRGDTLKEILLGAPETAV